MGCGSGLSISAVSDQLARVNEQTRQIISNPLSILSIAVLGPITGLIGAAVVTDQQSSQAVDAVAQDNSAQVAAVTDQTTQVDQATLDAQAASDAANAAANQAALDAQAAQDQATQAQAQLVPVDQTLPTGGGGGGIVPSTPSAPDMSFTPSGGGEMYSPMEMAQMGPAMPTTAPQLMPSGTDQNGNQLFVDQDGNYYDQSGNPLPAGPRVDLSRLQPSVPLAPEGETLEMPTGQFGPLDQTMETTPEISSEYTQDSGQSPFDQGGGSSSPYDGFRDTIRRVQRMGEAEAKNVDEVAPNFMVKNVFLQPKLEEPERIMMYVEGPLNTDYKGPLLPDRKMIVRKNMIVMDNRFLPVPDSTLPEYGEIDTPGYVPKQVGFANDFESNPRRPISTNLGDKRPVNGSAVRQEKDMSVTNATRFFKHLESEFTLVNKQLEFALEHKLRIRGIDKGKELNPILTKLNAINAGVNKLAVDIKSRKLVPTTESDIAMFNHIVDQVPELAKASFSLREEIVQELGKK